MASLSHILNEENIDPTKECQKEENERKNFLEQLERFLSNIGKPMEKIPQMGYQNLDLFLLFNLVQESGGYGKVTKKMGTWSKIWRRLPNYDGSITDASSRLKRHYERFLLDFEYETFPERRAQNATQVRFSLMTDKPMKRHKSAPKVTKDVPRDLKGRIIFPIVLGEITIHSLGRFQASVSKQWPIGYRSSRMFASMINPGRRVRYESCIVNQNNCAKFMVTAEDNPNPIVAESPSAAWKCVLERVAAPKSVCVSGSLRYGLLHPTVKMLIEEMKSKLFKGEANSEKKRKGKEPDFPKEKIVVKKIKLNPAELLQSLSLVTQCS